MKDTDILTNIITDNKPNVILNSFSYFRAVAIILIVAGHCFELMAVNKNTQLEKLLFSLIDGGSALFVFISGFLFYHVFYKKYNFIKFVKHKFIKIFIPYLVIGIPISLFYVLKQKTWYSGFFLPDGIGIFNTYIEPLFWYIVTGKMLGPYWYIPFIMLMFMLSALHIRFIELSLKNQLVITLIFTVMATIVHKPAFDQPSTFPLIIYYTPFYLIGIMCSMNKESIYLTLKGKEYFLVLALIIFAYGESFVGSSGNFTRDFFLFNHLNLMLFQNFMLVQKIILSIFFLIFLHRFEHKNFRSLKVVANTSFAIYFLHIFIILAINKLNLQSLFDDSWIRFLLLVLFNISICTFFALGLKKVFGAKSSYLIGY